MKFAVCLSLVDLFSEEDAFYCPLS